MYQIHTLKIKIQIVGDWNFSLSKEDEKEL